MEMFHNSQDQNYREPFGAVSTGSRVILRLRVFSDTPPDLVTLRLFREETETLLPMALQRVEGGSYWYQIFVFAGEEPCLLWYDFIVKQKETTLYYSNSSGGLGGIGTTTAEPVANSYQITVYDKDYHTPDWFKGRIMYQIFPDRFYRSRDEEIPKKREEYMMHQDWYEPLSFQRHPFEDGPACNDFYGGNLQGILEKLPYLKSLGVGVLYLNPIFEAYSNHRYDTANYKVIDPILGTEQDFCVLCKEAEKQGIRIILDGVFSHTGADSVYFNKYGSYGENQGAFRDEHSPYRSWYRFCPYPKYESWWGCSNLPNVNETEPSYLDYILRDEDAVIKKWVKKGASGWRLDVADELPDEFIRILRAELKKTNPDAVVIGEVWEDASNKIAYGKQREYLLGKELDSVMNYPFQEQVLGFLTGDCDAEELCRRVMSQLENYPKETLYALMNMLGTHDTMRVKSLLGGMSGDCGASRLSSGAEETAVKRLKLGVFLQMTFYGVPCIYYGDEVGMQGGKDPFNRGTFPWRSVDPELLDWYRRLGALRNAADSLQRGYFRPVYAEGGVYGYLRYFINGRDPFGNAADGAAALCLVNRDNTKKEVSFLLPELVGATLEEVFLGERRKVKNASFTAELPPCSASLYLEMEQHGRY